jgi:hypothetical protein
MTWIGRTHAKHAVARKEQAPDMLINQALVGMKK